MATLSYDTLHSALEAFCSKYFHQTPSEAVEPGEGLRERLAERGQLGDATALAEALLALTHPDPRVVERAAFLLGHARHQAAVPTMLALLARDDRLIAPALVWSLGMIGDARALRSIERLWSQGICREQCAEAMARIGDVLSVAWLSLGIADPHVRTRLYAAGALAHILSLHAESEALAPYRVLRDKLEKCLRDPFPPMRVLIAACLASLGRQFHPNEMRTLLEISASAAQLSSMQRFFAKT